MVGDLIPCVYTACDFVFGLSKRSVCSIRGIEGDI